MPLLTWRDRDADLTRAALAPYRLLEHRPELSYGDQTSPNMLIQGDNLDALKALLPYYAGQVKCVFIDPPYNTKSAFEHYDDNLEHSQWLSMMYPRLELLRDLLRQDGSLWITVDDSESHYLKVMADEVLGRANFLGDIAYERSGVSGLGQGGSFLVNTHERILVYGRNKSVFRAHDLSGSGELESKDMKRYNQVLVNPGTRTEVGRFVAPSTGEDVVIYRHDGFERKTISLRKFEERKTEILDEYVSNFDVVHRLTSVQDENEFQNRIMSMCGDGLYSADYLVSRGRLQGERVTTYYFGQSIVVWLKDTARVEDGQIVRTGKLSDFWAHRDIPKADLANEGGVDFRRGKKPEALLARILRIATREGELVLDSFLGSGTTAAVAHKMRRRWIGVEVGEQARTHAKVRLASVIDGDTTGVSEKVEWKGGGGFRFFTLGPSLFDEAGNVREGTPFAHLAAHVWFSETKVIRAPDAKDDVLLGVHEGTAYYLLYGEPAQGTGTTLTRSSLRKLPPFDGPKVVFGEACLLSDEQLEERQISFKQLPYDLKAR